MDSDDAASPDPGEHQDHEATDAAHPDYSHIDLFHVDPSVLGSDPLGLTGLQHLGAAGAHHPAGDLDPGTDVELGGLRLHLEATDEGHGVHLGPLPNVHLSIGPAHQHYDPHNPLSDWVPSFNPYLELGGDPPDPIHPEQPVNPQDDMEHSPSLQPDTPPGGD
jgi:hypothetical protein